MKYKTKIIALLLLVSILFACNQSATPKEIKEEVTGEVSDETLTVFTSLYPMYDFAKKIGGEKVNVINMVPAGTEPHDWEPNAKDMAGLEEADIFIYSGAGMEIWVDKVLNALSTSDLKVVEASEGIDLIALDEQDEDEEYYEQEEENEEADIFMASMILTCGLI